MDRSPLAAATGEASAALDAFSHDTVFDDLKPKIEAEIEKAIGSGVDDMYQLQQVIRRVVGKWVSDTHRRRPMIIPVVVES